jgi:hypothetical protein
MNKKITFYDGREHAQRATIKKSVCVHSIKSPVRTQTSRNWRPNPTAWEPSSTIDRVSYIAIVAYCTSLSRLDRVCAIYRSISCRLTMRSSSHRQWWRHSVYVDTCKFRWRRRMARILQVRCIYLQLRQRCHSTPFRAWLFLIETSTYTAYISTVYGMPRSWIHLNCYC